MFKIKKLISILLIIVLTFCFQLNIYASNTQIKDSTIYAKVIQIIDTNAIKVSINENEIAYVKLKGIKGNGFDKGVEYLNNTILGEQVMLILDGYSQFDGKWNYMQVYYNGLNISNELVLNGYAIIDNTQFQGSNYNTLLKNQTIASGYQLGMWENEAPDYSSITGGNNSKPQYTKNKVNINTASLNQLKTLLKNIPSEVCENIIYYRERNPFTTIQEIKFVKGFTKEMYNQNKDFLAVSTNVNTANPYELETLGLTNGQIDTLLDIRADKEIKNTSDLIPKVFTYSQHQKLKPFISTSNVNEIDYIISSSIANINGSDASYLQKIGLTYQEANEIIKNRTNGYTYKTLMELGEFKNNYLSETSLHKYEDNLSLLTNLNSSFEEELIYLFGYSTGKKVYNASFSNKEQLKNYVSDSEYQKYKDAVYVNNKEEDYINVNTATKTQMQEKGLTSEEISKIVNSRPILNANDFTFNISRINSKISLYTNINKATRNELYSLGLDYSTIDKIINYRNEQPFGSKTEIKEFFQQNNISNIYSKIEKYLVVR